MRGRKCLPKINQACVMCISERTVITICSLKFRISCVLTKAGQREIHDVLCDLPTLPFAVQCSGHCTHVRAELPPKFWLTFDFVTLFEAWFETCFKIVYEWKDGVVNRKRRKTFSRSAFLLTRVGGGCARAYSKDIAGFNWLNFDEPT